MLQIFGAPSFFLSCDLEKAERGRSPVHAEQIGIVSPQCDGRSEGEARRGSDDDGHEKLFTLLVFESTSTTVTP